MTLSKPFPSQITLIPYLIKPDYLTMKTIVIPVNVTSLEYSIGARGIAVGGITAVHWDIIGDD